MNLNDNDSTEETTEKNGKDTALPSVSCDTDPETGAYTKTFRAFNESMEVFEKIVMFNFSVGRKASDAMKAMREIYDKFRGLNEDSSKNTGLRGRLVVGFDKEGGKYKSVSAECDVVDGNNKTSFNIRVSSEKPGVVEVTECRPGVLSIGEDPANTDEIKVFPFKKKSELADAVAKVRKEYDDFIASLSSSEENMLSVIDEI